MIEVREARLSDLGPVLHLCERMHSETKYSRFLLDLVKTAGFVRRLMEAPDGYVGIAVDGDRVVGVMLAAVHEMWFSPARQVSEIMFYVVPASRSGALVRRMVKGLEEWSSVQGASRVGIGISSGVDVDRKDRLMGHLGFESAGGLYVKDDV